MGESKKTKGLVKKIFSVLSGKPSDTENNIKQSKSKFAPTEKDPVDLVFVKNFTRSGGKFLYCESEEDAQEFLQNIIKEAGIKRLYCCDSNLQSILNSAHIDYSCSDLSKAEAFCTNCEYLVSFVGGIMISDKQTKGKKLSELPNVFVTIARTSQIVENLREGLTGIRNRYRGDIPSNITTLKGPIKESDIESSLSGNTCSKEIYLLLLEDQINA